ncbi:hypothetical protein SVIOM74S_09984 [Streptomyces violarus]
MERVEGTTPNEAAAAVADGEEPPQGPPAPGGLGDDDGRTGGADGNNPAEDEAGAGRPRRRWFRRAALALLIALLPLLTAETALYVNYQGDPAQGTHTRNRDALWLGHAWVDGRKKDADVTALARRLQGTGIRDLYVHSGPLEHDGTLPESVYPRARWFIDAVHEKLPGIRVQAFLGDVLAGEGADGMVLEKPDTRAAVVRSARQILDTGYEGIHLDLEPMPSGDRDYLTLLDALRRETRSRNAQLSVAAHQIRPAPGPPLLLGLCHRTTPSGGPRSSSARWPAASTRSPVMSYDTAQPLEGLQRPVDVAQQTSLALEVTPPSDPPADGPALLLREPLRPLEPTRAAVAAAVRGVRLGLSRTDACTGTASVSPRTSTSPRRRRTGCVRNRDDWVR